MNKASLVSEVCARTGMSRRAVEMAIESTLDAIADQLSKGDTVILQGFGTFSPQKRAARKMQRKLPVRHCLKNSGTRYLTQGRPTAYMRPVRQSLRKTSQAPTALLIR